MGDFLLNLISGVCNEREKEVIVFSRYDGF